MWTSARWSSISGPAFTPPAVFAEHPFATISDPGSLISTGRSTDIAVNGQGMLPVTTIAGLDQPAAEREFLMVPTGSFQTDADGFLRTDSGLYLMGWNVDANGEATGNSRTSPSGLVPINVTEGSYSAEVTNRVQFGVNLPGESGRAATGQHTGFPDRVFRSAGPAPIHGYCPDPQCGW